MGGGAADPKRPLHNPNWAQLQLLLNGEGRRRRRPKPLDRSTNSTNPPPDTVLGKRKERPGLEQDASPPSSAASVLNPVSDDCSLTDALAMDCEMVGVGIDGTKSALGRVTLVNTWGNVVYDEFVHPIERVVDFRTAISGIRPHNLRKAKDFRTVQKKVSNLLKGRILVGHALHNDFKVLLLSHPKKDIRDTSEYQPLLREGKRRALRHLAAQILGVNIQQREHCSVEDARAVMLIYLKYKRDWEKSIKEQLRLRKKLGKHGRKKKHKEEDFAEPNGEVTLS